MKKTLYQPAPPGPAEGGTLVRAARAWDRFWFRPADPLPLGVIRLFGGVVILYIHLVYSLDLLPLLGPRGWVDTEAMTFHRQKYEFYRPTNEWLDMRGENFDTGLPTWSVFFHVTEPGWIIAIHVLFLLCMLLFTVGLWTRVTAVLTWVALLSYIHRMPTTLFGMHTIMNILVIYLMIGPSGAALSLDRWLARRRARRQGRELPPPEPSATANLALRLMQVHFCVIYLASGLSKLQGSAWWTGTAVWGTVANYSFAPMHWPAYINFLEFLSRHRFLWELMMFSGTYFTLALEISFPFLVWRPSLRWVMIILAVLLHTGIGLLMGLTTFSLCMLCLLLCFVPAPTLHRFVNALTGPGPAAKEPAAAGGKGPRQRPVLTAPAGGRGA